MDVQLQSDTQAIPRGCELCGSTAARELYTAKDRLHNSDKAFAIVWCEGCGVMRTLPEMTDRELQIFYPEDYWGAAYDPPEEWIRASQLEKTGFMASCGLESGRILDVGCGSGFFLRALDRSKWEGYGIEIGQIASKAAAAALGRDRLFTGTLVEAECADAFFDVITFWSALEHTNEPRANLKEARRIIKQGGTLVVQVPNAGSYQARLFRGDWFALDVPRHRYHFTKERLSRLLSEAGFEAYRTSFYSKSHNAHALRQSLKQKLVGSDRSKIGYALFCLSVPFIRPVDWLLSAIGEGATLTVAARAV